MMGDVAHNVTVLEVQHRGLVKGFADALGTSGSLWSRPWMDVPSVEAEAEHVRYEFGSDEVRQSGYGWSRSLRQNIGKP